MAHQDHIVDRLSNRLPSILPDHIQEESPVFEQFLSAYFEYLESEIITLEDTLELSGVELEAGTVVGSGNLTLEDDGNILIPRISENDTPEPDTIVTGEYIVGSKSGSVAKVRVRSGNTLFVDTISGTGFAIGETITGRDGGQTSKIKSYKENQIVANNRLLDYADIDQTLETFLDHFQKDFIPSLDLGATQNKRLTLKNIGTLYKQKGTAESIKFLMRILFGLNSDIKYPIDETIFAGQNDFDEDRRVFVQMDSGEFAGIPKATDKIIQYDANDSTKISAQAIVEQVEIISTIQRQYSVKISRSHEGIFEHNRLVTFTDRDGVTQFTGTLKGIISEIIEGESSTTFGIENEVGDLLLEDGSALLFEGSTIGSLYDEQDVIRFTGAKSDTEEVDALGVVAEVSRGSVEKVFIETAGTGYSAGDMVIFDNTGTGGHGAEGVIGAVGDELILENSIGLDQYELIATAGQTTFGGLDSNGNTILDLNLKPIALDGRDVRVFVNGIEQSQDNFTTKLDRVIFSTSPTPSGGERVELVSKFSRLIKEDGERIFLEQTDTRIRVVEITSGGAGYKKLPLVSPGGHIYIDDVKEHVTDGNAVVVQGYIPGETVTGLTSNATGIVQEIDVKNQRLIIKRSSTDTGTFATGEIIKGGTSLTQKTNRFAKVSAGTGGVLFAHSSKVGGIKKIRLTSQGYNFDEDAVLDDLSTFNMLVTQPTSTANLTKGVTFTGADSGATGVVISFDDGRNLLKFENRTGTFLDGEEVNYASSNKFKVLKFDPYDARGKLAGEGVINDNFFGDRGNLSNTFSNIQDSLLYQTHSYVVKVGKSIEEYKAVLKDLVHPSGHIFFGEVAVEQVIVQKETADQNPDRFSVELEKNELANDFGKPFNTLGIQNTTFVPTINIELEHTEHILLEDHDEVDNTLVFIGKDRTNKLLDESSLSYHPVYVENEDAFEPSFHVDSQTMILFHTTQAELTAFNMGHVLKQYVQSGFIDTDNRPSNNTTQTAEAGRSRIETIKRFIANATQTKINNEISEPIASQAASVTVINQRSPRIDSAITVLNLTNTPTQGDGYFRLDQVEDGISPLGIRPQDQGKVFQFFQPSEEFMVFEDGTHIQLEEPLNRLVFEPGNRDVDGDNIQFEDATTDVNGTSLKGGTFLLQDITVPEQIERFVTERSNNLINPYLYYEDFDRIVLETGEPIVKEQSGTGSTIYSFAPLGPRFKSINKIAFQDTYRISYYLLDESRGSGNPEDPDFDNSEEDRIILESGTEGGSGHVLLEDSKRDGMRISQLNELLGTQYVDEYDLKDNRRVNFTFSSYVNSSNITNSTLASL
tara:strand:- start:39250 stop:43221 length:3972 start_codon:yes stop_codon:yes gene_type:complete